MENVQEIVFCLSFLSAIFHTKYFSHWIWILFILFGRKVSLLILSNSIIDQTSEEPTSNTHNIIRIHNKISLELSYDSDDTVKPNENIFGSLMSLFLDFFLLHSS